MNIILIWCNNNIMTLFSDVYFLGRLPVGQPPAYKGHLAIQDLWILSSQGRSCGNIP